MERTHLDDREAGTEGMKAAGGEEEVNMEDVESSVPTNDAISPSAKRRLASRPSVRSISLQKLVLADFSTRQASSPNSLTSSLSLSESIALQQADVARSKEAARLRAEKAAAIERSNGSRLKGAMGGSTMESFM